MNEICQEPAVGEIMQETINIFAYPPPPSRLGKSGLRSLASITARVRPSSSKPSMACWASSASFLSLKRTKAKPLGSLVSLLRGMYTSPMSPYLLKASRRVSLLELKQEGTGTARSDPRIPGQPQLEITYVALKEMLSTFRVVMPSTLGGPLLSDIIQTLKATKNELIG